MKYTPERVELVLKALRERKGRMQACQIANISHGCLLNWIRDYPEFAEGVKKAEIDACETGKEYAVLCIFQAMDDHWQAAAWWLERNFPDKYASIKDKALHAGSQSGEDRSDYLKNIADAIDRADGCTEAIPK